MTKRQKKSLSRQFNLEEYLTKKKGQKLNPSWVSAPFADAITWENGRRQETGLRFSAMDRNTPIPKWI